MTVEETTNFFVLAGGLGWSLQVKLNEFSQKRTSWKI